MKKRSAGFLLLEALMSIALLGLGVAALGESFWIARQWMERGRTSQRMATCLDEHAWLSLSDIGTPSKACADGVAVRTEASPFATSLVRVKWTASIRHDEQIYENTIEGFRPAL